MAHTKVKMKPKARKMPGRSQSLFKPTKKNKLDLKRIKVRYVEASSFIKDICCSEVVSSSVNVKAQKTTIQKSPVRHENTMEKNTQRDSVKKSASKKSGQKHKLIERRRLHARNGIPYRDVDEEQLELDYASAHEVNKRNLDDFSDLNEGEKELMILWNEFICDRHGRSITHMPTLLRDFISEKGKIIARKTLFRNLILHLNSLTDAGLLDSATCFELISEFQTHIITHASSIDEGSRHRLSRTGRPRINSNHGGTQSAAPSGSPGRSTTVPQHSQTQQLVSTSQHRRSLAKNNCGGVKRGLWNKDSPNVRNTFSPCGSLQQHTDRMDTSGFSSKDEPADEDLILELSDDNMDSGRDSRTEIINFLDSFESTEDPKSLSAVTPSDIESEDLAFKISSSTEDENVLLASEVSKSGDFEMDIPALPIRNSGLCISKNNVEYETDSCMISEDNAPYFMLSKSKPSYKPGSDGPASKVLPPVSKDLPQHEAVYAWLHGRNESSTAVLKKSGWIRSNRNSQVKYADTDSIETASEGFSDNSVDLLEAFSSSPEREVSFRQNHSSDQEVSFN